MVLVYFVLGAVAFWAALWAQNWAKARGGTLAWYHWLGVAVVALWTLFLAAWVGTSLAEGYPKAALVGLLVWGLIDVILFVLLRLWVVRTVCPGAKGKEAKA